MSEFRLLTDLEHIKLRPNMYIGSVAHEPHERFVFGKFGTISYVPGLVKIIDEIIDNSVDEGIRTNFEYANQISVAFDGTVVEITDNGRGIPQKDVQTPEGKVIPQPVAAWTRTKAGSNFDDTNRVTQGMNGVGSSLTNAFSEWFIGETCDGENTIKVSCSDGANNIKWSVKKGGKQGTRVKFCPDFSHFEGMLIDQSVQDIIKDRLIALSVVFPKITFKFNGQKIQMKFKKYAAMFDENNICIEDDNYSIAFCNSPDGFRQVSYVNGLNIKNGGSHIDYLLDVISNELMPSIKRKFKLEVTKARIKESLTMVMVIRNMPNLRFDSQTKERLTNTWGEVKAHIPIDPKKLSNMIMKTESILMPIIETALARKLAAEKAALTKAQKAAAKVNFAKHIKAGQYGKGQDTTLFLTEGDSAIGYLLKVRDPELHGGYALRGKVMNTWGMKDADVIKNRELFEIKSIAGLEFEQEDVSDCKYQNFAIMTDADPDGQGSIYPCLLAYFARWPKLFEEKRIRFVKTPVIILEKGKKTEWFYTLPEYEAVKDKYKGYEVRYIKGLGSLREHEYKKIIREPVYDIVTLDDNYKELFDMLLGDNADLRKKWMAE